MLETESSSLHGQFGAKEDSDYSTGPRPSNVYPACKSLKNDRLMLLWGMNVKCEHCSSKNIVRNGIRNLVNSINQRYLCANCGKRFSSQKGKFNDAIILFAVSTYNSGQSLGKTVRAIRQKYKTDVDPSTLLRWARKHGASFLRLRKQLSMKYKKVEVVASKNFFHFGIMYPFMLHNWKLREFCAHEGLREYLLGLGPWVDRYFLSGTRCSQLDSVEDVNVIEKRNMLCTAVEDVLGVCDDLKERHGLIQRHLLYNDSSTIATEVPVWAYDKGIGTISGHIDLLQVRFGKIWVLDYKPAAKTANRLKVASQLYWYARALSFRAKVPLKDIMCGWFDGEICYEFDPCRVKLKDVVTGKIIPEEHQK